MSSIFSDGAQSSLAFEDTRGYPHQRCTCYTKDNARREEERNYIQLWQAVCFKIVDSKNVLCASPESTQLL